MELVSALCRRIRSQEESHDSRGKALPGKDLERMMTNLRNDAKRLGDAFNPAIGKSTIRKTQQEKEGKALVKTFEEQTNKMLDQFKQNKQAEPALTSVRDSARQIEKLLADVPLGRKSMTLGPK
jgi:hypothetical protein